MSPAAAGDEQRSHRPDSLVFRLTAWYAASAFLLLLVATWSLYWILERRLDQEDDQYLAERVSIIQALMRDAPPDGAVLRQEIEREPSARTADPVFIRLLGPGELAFLETPGMSERLPQAMLKDLPAPPTAPRSGVWIHGPQGRAFRVLPASVLGSDGRVWRIEVALDETGEVILLARYRTGLWFVLAIGLAASALLGRQIARWGIRPLAEMQVAVRRIGSSTLHERLDVSRFPREVRVLAESFNGMLERLQSAFSRVSRLSAEIAHELRTPINNLQGEAEVTLRKPRSEEEYREVIESLLEECLRLSRLIDVLLFLARAENPETQISRERLDLGRELAALRELYEAAAAEGRICLELAVETRLEANLDRTLLQTAVANLLENALRHTPAGGSVRLWAERKGDRVRVGVRDTGCGIPTEDLPKVFEPFYRASGDTQVAGRRIGLGLTIVKSVAELHGGSVEIRSEAGRGSDLELVLPG